jgi:predicted GNAT family N-acyltransferase
LMREAGKRGDAAVMLNAQTQAQVFYGRYGFVRDGDEFEEAGIAHIAMRRALG